MTTKVLYHHNLALDTLVKISRSISNRFDDSEILEDLSLYVVAAASAFHYPDAEAICLLFPENQDLNGFIFSDSTMEDSVVVLVKGTDGGVRVYTVRCFGEHLAQYAGSLEFVFVGFKREYAMTDFDPDVASARRAFSATTDLTQTVRLIESFADTFRHLAVDTL